MDDNLDSGQLDMFKHPHFDGKYYVPKFDQKRLTSQIKKLWNFMVEGQWRTLQEMENAIHAPQASISACLRDFRKKKFGYNLVILQSRGERNRGLWEYKLVPNLEGIRNIKNKNLRKDWGLDQNQT